MDTFFKPNKIDRAFLILFRYILGTLNYTNIKVYKWYISIFGIYINCINKRNKKKIYILKK